MKSRGTLCLGIACSLCLAAGTVEAQPMFELFFDGPDALSGPADGTVAQDYDCMLRPGGDLAGEGAQGWSLSASATGGVEVVGITTDNTIGAETSDDGPGLRSGGFEKSEVTSGGVGDCEGLSGAVSAVVLSFTEPITAPTDEPSRVAILSVEGTVPAGGGAGTLAYTNGCQGSGQPVENAVTHMGATIDPTVTPKEIALQESVECPSPGSDLQMILQSESTSQTSELFAGQAETPDPSQPAQVTLAPGQAEIFAGIVSNGLETGVQGWSLAVSVGDGVTLAAATTDGTVGADVTGDPPGLRSGGFEKTELIDPALNDQGQGAVSAVVLSFTEPIELETTGTATVLALTLEGELDDTALVEWRDGLQGSGQPVQNVATVGGGTVEYACQQSGQVTFSAPPVPRYRVGNANGDGRVDIADAVWIVAELFREGPESSCPLASDANEDGMMDLSDVTFLLEYLFFGGTAPADPSVCVEAPAEVTPEECVTQPGC